MRTASLKLVPTLVASLLSVAALALPMTAAARDHGDRYDNRHDRREWREDRRDARHYYHHRRHHHDYDRRHYRHERIVRETVIVRQPPRVVYQEPVYRERSGVVVQIGLPPIIFPLH